VQHRNEESATSFRCEVLQDDEIVVTVEGRPNPDDQAWLIDAVIEAREHAASAPTPLILDLRSADLAAIPDAPELIEELRRLAVTAGLELQVRAASRRGPATSG
jgi:hypothetical protein